MSKVKELKLATTFEEAVKVLLRTSPPPAGDLSTRKKPPKKAKKR